MPAPDATTVELAKLWSAAFAAIIVAVVSFATNLIVTLLRTGRREMDMRRHESDLRVKAELRLKLFTMQAEAVRDITLTLIQLVDVMDDWSHILVTAHQRTNDEFIRSFTEKQHQSLAAKRAFSASGLFMPPALHDQYGTLNKALLHRLVEMVKAADMKDAQAMRAHLPAINSATHDWTIAVAEWKTSAWPDVLETSTDRPK